MNSITVAIRVSVEVRDKLARLAQSTHHSRSYLAGEAVAAYVDRELSIIAGIELGLADVATGRTMSHEVTMARIDAGIAKTRVRIREVPEIVSRISDWAGGKDQAVAWCRAEPIPAFGGRTAESLTKTGKAAAVRDYLDHIARADLLEAPGDVLQIPSPKWSFKPTSGDGASERGGRFNPKGLEDQSGLRP